MPLEAWPPPPWPGWTPPPGARVFLPPNFSSLEISFTAVCIPRFLGAIITRDKTISYNNCAAQLFLSIFMGVTALYILTAVSYDRCVAICRPLHYATIRSRKLCSRLWSAHGSVGFRPFSRPLCFSPSWITVLPMSLITFCVTISPFYNCLVQMRGF